MSNRKHSQQLALFLDAETLKICQDLAAIDGRSLSMLLRSAIDYALRHTGDYSDPWNRPVRVPLFITPAMHEAVRLKAFHRRMSNSEWCARAVDAYLLTRGAEVATLFP
jgi:hypothetical protein